VAEGGGLLNADQHFGHLRLFSQILAFQSLPRSSELAVLALEARFWELAGTISGTAAVAVAPAGTNLAMHR
jgi:hypothetical protein